MTSTLAAEQVDLCPHRAVLGVMNISYAADLWLGELARSGHRGSTTDRYRRLLYKLADEHPTHRDVREVTPTDVRQFLDKQARRDDGRGRKSASTIAADVTTVNCFFDWLAFEGIIARNPTRRNGMRIISRPRKPNAEENDNVKSISSNEVRRMIAEADRGGAWDERLSIAVLAYLGPRRKAVALARLADYDQVEGTLTFREKGGKTIAKPVPNKLADLINAAINAGVYSTPRDYLIPGKAEQRRKGERDERVIYRNVKQVARRAGVDAHVHAFRAAFAVYFLEQNPGESVGLQKLMGHARPESTQVYLRRMNRRLAMESVRSLDWSDDSHANSEESFQAFPATEKEGFEPSFNPMSLLERDGTQREPSEPGDRA